MNNNAWIASFTFGLMLATPAVAHAHGQYLQGVSDTIEAEIATPACSLPMMTCGLCHQPLMGDRLENIVVAFKEIDTMDRNGPFYDSLTGEGGWDHLPHAMDNNVHRDMNLQNLLDNVLPTILANGTDSDGDGVPDLEELALGYNPLLPYEEADPMRSQLCAAAEPFPGGGGTGSTADGGESTGGSDSTSAGETTGGEESTGSPDGSGTDTSPGTSPGTNTNGGTGGSGGSGGTSGSDTGSGDDGGGGCRITGPDHDPKALGLLVVLGLVAGRRRRA